jgi:uncharacterized protein (UPF0332 family)
VDALMIRAPTAIASAQVLLDAGDFAGAINRAYYAMIYAARAALQHVGIEVASSKHGIWSQGSVSTSSRPATFRMISAAG